MATTPLNNVPPIGSMTGKGLGQSAQSKNHGGTTPWRRGHLSRMDEIPHGDPATAAAISEYGDYVDTNRSSQRWAACHVAGTKVLLPDGTSRSIESFRRGDSVQCPNGATKVKEVVEYQYDKLMTLFVDGHFPVDSTPEHEYLVIRKEKVLDKKLQLSSSFIDKAVPSSFVEKIQVKDIRPGDYVVSGFKRDRSLEPKLLLRKYISEPEHYGRNRSILPEVVQLDRDLLRVFGLYLGDGTANFKNGAIKFTFGLHELHLAEEVQAIIQKVFGVPCKIKTESNVIQVLAWSRSLVEFFINLLGGGKAAPKKIHPDIFNANIDLWPIITGICDADGCGLGNSILKKPDLRQKYQGLILQLRAISFDRGTRCHLSDWDRGKYGIYYKLYWGNYDTCSRKRFKITDGTFAFIVKNVESKDFEGSVYSLEVEDDSHVYQLSTCLHSGNTVQWVENILFGSGRQYIDDILANRITNNASSSDISIVRDTLDNIPRPVNDLLGRYIETNIALFTENKPMPRVEPKSDNIADQKAAELSMLALEHLWEALEMPEKNREIARLMLYTGTAWKEIVWDESIPRRVSVPQTETSPTSQIIGPDGTPVSVPVPRQIQKFNRDGTLATTTKVEYGDLTARIVSAFEMHIPVTHHWDEIDWIMREYYMPIDSLKSQYETAWKRKKNVFTKKNGWFLDNLEKIASENVTRLPLWWWERLSTLVEGPGQSLYIGSPEQWDGYAIVRIFDRKPNELWPKGRTVITAGNQVLYDSPPDRGARAYDPRWPERWHPYIRFRWEPMVGSIWGRSLVSKLLPKLKRVNAIDTTLIMWRRTIPMSAWISPKGCGKSGTYVLSCESKTVRIEDIKIGDVVQTKTGTGKVLQKFEYDNDEQLYKIRAKGLLPIEFTGNHLIPVIPKEALQKVKRSHTKPYVHNYNVITNQDIVEKAVEEIKVGDLVLSQFSRGRDGIEKLDLSVYINGYKFLRNPVPKYVEIDKDLLRLLGLYLAEGSTGNNCSLKWTVGLHEKDTLGQEIKNLVFKIFGLNTPFEESHGNGSRLQVWLSSSPIRDLFLALSGRGAPNKQIASEIFNYPGSLLPLVGGLIDGDGSSQKIPQSKDGRTRTWKQSRYYTTSRDLAYQVRGILLDEKIPCSMSVDSKNRNHPKYILNFDSTAREQLAPYCNKFRELSHQKTARQGFWVDKFFCSPIKKIEKVDYTGKVYDLEIEGDHYYQASGIVVHNSHPQKDLWSGRPGLIWEYDPRQTAGMAPEVVHPPAYPEAALREREQQLQEMEFIAGTEQVLRGERPSGVNSAAALDILRKQALSSRSAILQAWDESLQKEGTAILQEVIKHVRSDPRYLERIRILAREKASALTIHSFSGEDLSDNVIVRVDTMSQALLSKEAKEAKTLEFLQYAGNLMQLPFPLQQALLDRLGIDYPMQPQGIDVERIRRMISWIKMGDFRRVIPMAEDDPFIAYELLVQETKKDSWWDLSPDQQNLIFQLMDKYKQMIEFRMIQQQLAQQGGAPPEGGGQGGAPQGGGAQGGAGPV